ncbi:hypothetical protein OAE25_02025 [Verrucomicrobiales bacterium]|nr:hypothetical protein [Verrucomicrobiales bacterium]
MGNFFDQGSDNREHENNDRIMHLADPKNRMPIQKQIAQGTTTEADDQRDGKHADEIHLLLTLSRVIQEAES